MLEVKHIQGKLHQVLGFENEEAMDKAINEDKTITSDLKVFMSVYMAASEAPALSAILTVVTGLDLGRPSEVAEYVIKNTTDEDDRRGLVQNLMAIKMAELFNGGKKGDVMSMMEDMLKKG